MALRRGAVTDIGRMRKNNEDRFLSAGRLAAVADGMGGHRAGEVASAIAMEELASLEHAGPWPNPGEAVEALRRVFLRANHRIREVASRDKELDGMGTTLVALLEDGDSVHLANVGDSRAYLLRGGELTQVTVDHTLVQELIDEGRLRPEEAERHPQRSVITRALGVDTEVEVDLFTYKLQPGDRVLLCSDGLSGVVPPARIRNLLLRVLDPQDAAERLVAMANESGGPDNVTVMVLDAGDPAAGAVGAGERTGDLAAAAATTGAIPMARGDTGEMLTGLHPRVGSTAGRAGRAGGQAAGADGSVATRAGRRGADNGRAGGREASSRAGRYSRRRRGRRVLVGVLVLAVLAGIAFGGRQLLFSRYWVGFDDGRVAVFNGVPGDVAGLRFWRVVERTGIDRAAVPPAFASRLEGGISASSLADARRIANCSRSVFSEAGCPDGAQAPASTVTATTKRTTPTTKARPTSTTRRG